MKITNRTGSCRGLANSIRACRNINFNITARRRPIDRRYYEMGIASQRAPLCVAYDHNRNLAPCQFLLVTDILVCGYEHFKAGLLCAVEQRSVAQTSPTPFERFNYIVPLQMLTKGSPHILIK
jgi:hypothetical protein